MLESLYKVSNYIIYGHLPWKHIEDLLKTWGHINIDEKKVPLNDNNQIESLFEQVGVICIDDIVEVYASYEPKEAFEAVN